jgi:hypothetical protein
LQLFTHIASPEVLVDDERQRFVLFFHGRPEDNDRLRPQATVPAVSDDGLDFRDGLVPCSPGNAYLRVFQASGRTWGLGGLLRLYRGPESSSPTDEQGLRAPEDFPVTERHYWQELPLMDKVETEWAGDLGLGREGRVRHLALRPLGEGLFDLFYTVKCASPPERILATRLDARSPDWTDWTVTAASEVMRPERAWEGANEPCVTSEGGAGSGLNQLRDPYVLENEGRIYLYYSGAGETAIGVAELTHD